MYPTAKLGNRVLHALLALAFGTGLHPTAQAQIIQQGAKLVGTGAVGAAGQGFSVALSGDGNTAIAGAYMDSNADGAAWVYTRSGGVWSQQGGKLVGMGAVGIDANQGHSVALSADGNTAIVSGLADNGLVGAAWVYTRAGGAWSQQGAKLVGTGAAGKAFQGSSVALSGDGNTALVGGAEDNGQVGAAWVYTRAGGVWSQQGGKLVGTGAVGPYCSQGNSVALSADGITAIVGGPGDNGYAGAAWVYTRAGGAQGIMQAAIFSPISGSGGGSLTGTGCRTQPIAPASSHPSGTPSLLRVARFPAMDCVYVRRCFQRNERVVPRRRGGSAPASKHRRRSSCGCSGCRPAHRAYASDSSAPARGAPPIRDNRPPSTVHTAPFTNDELE